MEVTLKVELPRDAATEGVEYRLSPHRTNDGQDNNESWSWKLELWSDGQYVGCKLVAPLMELGDYVTTDADLMRGRIWLRNYSQTEPDSLVEQVKEFVDNSYPGERLFFCPVPK